MIRSAATRVAAIVVVVLAAASGSGVAQAAPPGFVTASGTSLELDGQPYRFTGINIYNANNLSGCWYPMGSGSILDDSLTAIGGPKVIRAWFFQGLATTDGARDWSAIDNTLTVAAAHGTKVVVTLANQWSDCDGPNGGAGAFKDEAWYTGGYTQTHPGGTVSYRDWVAEIVDRYRDDPTILAWQLMNEAEVKPSASSGCSTNAAQILRDFAADVSGLIKSIDPNHLVSLGTIGGGQCGAQGAEYEFVHDVPTIDLCEYHDYGSPTVPMPGDQWNGLQVRVDQCNTLGMPLFVGETGIRPQDVPATGSPLYDRANAFEAKFRAQFAAGIDGQLVWAWSALGSTEDNYDIGANDPTLRVLENWTSASAGSVSRASLTASGGEPNDRSLRPYVTSDGRYVLFSSEATNLSPDDTFSNPGCGALDVFLKDRQTGAVELVNVDSNENQLMGVCGSVGEGISEDGRYIVFESDAYRSTSTYAGSDVLVRDRVAGTTRNLTAGANNRSGNAAMTPDGRYVLFGSEASNLVSGTDACGLRWRQYVYDLVTSTIELVSVDSNETDPCGGNGSNIGSISAEGRFVAFYTDADLVPEDVGAFPDSDIYLRDRQSGTTTLVSKGIDGAPVGSAFSPAISADGRFVGYVTDASNVVPNDTNGLGGSVRGYDVFLYDRVNDETERVSVTTSGHEFEASFGLSLSARGRFVAFSAGHPPLGSGDTSGYFDVYVRDRATGTTQRLENAGGAPIGAGDPMLNLDGRLIAFSTYASDVVPGDTNGAQDVFVYERSGPVEPPFVVDTDADDDGIEDSIDTGDGTFSDGETAGTISANPGAHTVTISDLADPDGVLITVSGTGTQKVTFVLTNPLTGDPCGTIKLLPGAEVEVTCGSITVSVAAGSPPVEIVLSNDTSLFVEEGESATVEVSPGSFVVEDVTGGDGQLTLVADGVSSELGESSTPISLFDFVGFKPPVANGGALNAVKPGNAVPLKWKLLTEAGAPVTNLASASVQSRPVNCNTKAPTGPLAAGVVGSLQNQGQGSYQLDWKTTKGWTGCRLMQLSLAGEGPVTHNAYFRFG